MSSDMRSNLRVTNFSLLQNNPWVGIQVNSALGQININLLNQKFNKGTHLQN